jgi:hypothetical protein
MSGFIKRNCGEIALELTDEQHGNLKQPTEPWRLPKKGTAAGP